MGIFFPALSTMGRVKPPFSPENTTKMAVFGQQLKEGNNGTGANWLVVANN
jgi:hypothetical protein